MVALLLPTSIYVVLTLIPTLYIWQEAIWLICLGWVELVFGKHLADVLRIQLIGWCFALRLLRCLDILVAAEGPLLPANYLILLFLADWHGLVKFLALGAKFPRLLIMGIIIAVWPC